MTALTLPDTLPITIDAGIMSGAPVFRDTRVPVETLFDYIMDDCTLEQFLDNFPTVHREDAIMVLGADTRSYRRRSRRAKPA